MKKILATLLMLVLLLSVAGASAENLYAQPINFGNYTFGMTFAEARTVAYVHGIQFWQAPRTTRAIADVAGDYLGIRDLDDAAIFYARVNGREVAGYYAEVELYFTYPMEDGKLVRDESRATLYAGIYEINSNENGEETFNDLKDKLTRVYGEPLTVTGDANEIWGEYPFPADREWARDDYTSRVAEFAPQYVVWKSGANGVMVVLTYWSDWGYPRVKINYLDPSHDEVINSLGGASVVSNSLEGL